jgi:membrane associated rhomboid family serine protease
MFEEFKNAFQRHNNGHVQLILINVVVYLVLVVFFVISTVAQFPGFFDTIHSVIAIPAPLMEFFQKPWTIITYAFVHDWTGILHILFNMLFLYWFGRLFVEYLGSDKLIAVYFLGALAGGIAYLFMYNLVPYYEARMPGGGMVGASAAVFAIVVATATLLPDFTFFLLLLGPVKIKYIAAFYVMLSILGSVGSNEGGNIAHLGGALMGFVYIKQLQAGVNWGNWITAVIEWCKGLFTPKPKVKVTYRKEASTAAKKTAKGPNVSQDEIDTILDKIPDGGYESLTKEEKEKLFNASKK